MVSRADNSPINKNLETGINNYAKENKLTFVIDFLNRTDLGNLTEADIKKSSSHFLKRLFKIPSEEQRLKQGLLTTLRAQMGQGNTSHSNSLPLTEPHKRLIQNLNAQLGGKKGALEVELSRAKEDLAEIERNLETAEKADSDSNTSHSLRAQKESAETRVSAAQNALNAYRSSKVSKQLENKALQKNIDWEQSKTTELPDGDPAKKKELERVIGKIERINQKTAQSLRRTYGLVKIITTKEPKNNPPTAEPKTRKRVQFIDPTSSTE